MPLSKRFPRFSNQAPAFAGANSDGTSGLARAWKPSIGMVSARASGDRPAASQSVAPPRTFKLERSILRRWPKAAAVTFCRASSRAGSGRSVRGTRRTTAEATLGGGVKARAGTSMTMRASAVTWAITASRP